MVAYNTVKASNALLLKSTSTKPLTAVFVGATSGIGLATLKSFAQSTSSPNAYICGRSRRAFQPHLDLLQRSNPGGNFQFITAEVSLIAEVDRVCKEILAKEDNVDSLWLSCGVLNLGGRDGMLYCEITLTFQLITTRNCRRIAYATCTILLLKAPLCAESLASSEEEFSPTSSLDSGWRNGERD